MKFLFHLGHPAHYHLFKHTIKELLNDGHEAYILIKKKDILEDLLIHDSFPFISLLPKGRKDGFWGIFAGLIIADIRMFFFCVRKRPDILVGTSVVNSHVGKILRIPVINVNEDDVGVVPFYTKLSYPWAKVIIAPSACFTGKWNKKTVNYSGYHELAYLHPSRFKPDKRIVRKYLSLNRPYFVIRFAKLSAHHDKGMKGLNFALMDRLIEILKPQGRIIITSEIILLKRFEEYRLPIKPNDMHHFMAFAHLYIGDSQTMAAEAGILGIPFIRFNDFVGRIGYLNELENKYKLGYGFNSLQGEEMLQKVKNLLNKKNLEFVWNKKRQEMLKSKIDVSSFLTWFIKNYPESVKIMKEFPDYQYKFK